MTTVQTVLPHSDLFPVDKNASFCDKKCSSIDENKRDSVSESYPLHTTSSPPSHQKSFKAPQNPSLLQFKSEGVSIGSDIVDNLTMFSRTPIDKTLDTPTGSDLTLNFAPDYNSNLNTVCNEAQTSVLQQSQLILPDPGVAATGSHSDIIIGSSFNSSSLPTASSSQPIDSDTYLNSFELSSEQSMCGNRSPRGSMIRERPDSLETSSTLDKQEALSTNSMKKKRKRESDDLSCENSGIDSLAISSNSGLSDESEEDYSCMSEIDDEIDMDSSDTQLKLKHSGTRKTNHKGKKSTMHEDMKDPSWRRPAKLPLEIAAVELVSLPKPPIQSDNFLTRFFPDDIVIFEYRLDREILKTKRQILSDTAFKYVTVDCAENSSSALVQLNRKGYRGVFKVHDLPSAQSPSFYGQAAYTDSVELNVFPYLEYPVLGARETFCLLGPRTRYEYDSLGEINQAMSIVAQELLSKELHEELNERACLAVNADDAITDQNVIYKGSDHWASHSFTKLLSQALKDRNALHHNALLAEFNTFIMVNRQAILTHMSTLERLPISLARHINDSCYYRVVGPSVKQLKSYKAFSSNVYGELRSTLVGDMISQTGLTELGNAGNFVDLGSGMGGIVTQVALECGSRCFGIEQMQIPSDLATKLVLETQRRCEMWGIKAGHMTVVQGDFLLDKQCRDALADADVILCNNYAFSPQLNDAIGLLFFDCKEGTKIVSLKPFRPVNYSFYERNYPTSAAVLRTQEHQYPPGSVSWTAEGGRYWIQTVDRSEIREALIFKRLQTKITKQTGFNGYKIKRADSSSQTDQ